MGLVATAVLDAAGMDARESFRVGRLDGLLLVALRAGQDVELSPPGGGLRQVACIVEVEEREVIEDG